MSKKTADTARRIVKNKVFRVCVYILVALGVLVGGFMLGWRILVRPPEIPLHGEQPFLPGDIFHPRDNENGEAFEVVEPHPDDAFIGAHLTQDSWVRRDNFFTALIFGYDMGRNTDTIMVAAFDLDNREAFLLNIPRDTRVDVTRRSGRINAAYAAGRAAGGGHEGGVDQLRREVQTIIGFIPDFYLSVDERAFARIVDAVGGVNITVPFRMYYTDAAQDLFIDIPAGLQRLDGENALHFVRYRVGNNPAFTISDYRRMEHTQMFIRAVLDELMTPMTILRVPELIRTYRDHINSDLSFTEKLFFAEQFLAGDVQLHTYSYPTTPLRDIRWYQLPNQEEAIALINRTINPFTQDLTGINFQFVR